MADDQRTMLVQKMVAEGTGDDDIRATLKVFDTQHAAAPAKEERSVGGFLSNVASSSGRFIKDAVTGIPAAAGMVGNAAMMLANPAAHAQDYRSIGENLPGMASAAGTALKNRYGGVEQIKNTLYNDPVGVAADLSMVMDPAAIAAKAGGLAKTAGVLTRGAELTNPLRAVSKPVGEMLERAAPGLWDSAAKVPQALKDRNPNMDIAQAGVKRGMLVTRGGTERNAKALSNLRKEKAALAATNTDPIDVSAISDSLDDLKGQYSPGLSAREDMAAVNKIANRLMAKPTVQSGASGFVRTIPVKDAVPTISAIDAKLRGKFGREGGPIVEAMKAVRHGLGAGVNETSPAIGKINAELGERAVLQRSVKRAVDRNANTNFLNTMGTGIGAGVTAATALTTHDPMLAVAAGIGTRLADTPLVKSGASIAMDRAGMALQSPYTYKSALLARLLGAN